MTVIMLYKGKTERTELLPNSHILSLKEAAAAVVLPRPFGGMEYTEEQKQTAGLVRQIEKASPYGIKGFYRTYAWKKKRRQILARDHQACQECRKKGRYTKAVMVHHIRHLQDEPALALTDDNLESVCKDCHEKLHPERNRHKNNFVNIERW